MTDPPQDAGRYAPPGYGQPPDSRPGYAPPPFGQPPFGPPQPRRKRRTALLVVIVGILVLVVPAAIVVALSLRSTRLDPHAVERDVGAQFQEQEGVGIELRCPDDMAVGTGKAYECTGVTADGEDVTVQIAITDEEQAAYTWTER